MIPVAWLSCHEAIDYQQAMQGMRSPASSALWVISILFVTFCVCHHSQLIKGVNCMLFDYG